jgi:hypothetical protein
MNLRSPLAGGRYLGYGGVNAIRRKLPLSAGPDGRAGHVADRPGLLGRSTMRAGLSDLLRAVLALAACLAEVQPRRTAWRFRRPSSRAVRSSESLRSA